MKISFEGSISEFRLIFGGAAVSTAVRGSTLLEQVELDSSKVERVNERKETWVQPEGDVSRPDDTHALAPEYAEQAAATHFWRDQLPVPTDDDPHAPRAKTVLPTVDAAVKKQAWAAFVEFCGQWATNFGEREKEQPDRLALMQELGHGRMTIPILVMAYEIKSLQRLVERALWDAAPGVDFDLNWVDQLACNMVQVSHMGFPDLAGTYDYSTSWRRNEPQWSKP